MDELRDVISSFSFDRCNNGNQGFSRILIQLFGYLGHGKSSFINTCIYVWQDGEYQNWAETGNDDGGKTLDRIPHKLTNNIMVVDNRGLKNINQYETGVIFAQLGNLLPLGKAVEWSEGFSLVDRIVNSEKIVKYSDFIVPVFVYSVKKKISSEETDELRNVFNRARQLTGIYPIVVLTHRSFGNLTSVESSFRDMGIERIFAFENYTEEDHFKTRGRHEEVLKFLLEVIKDAQFRVEHEKRNPVKEMQERKQFVINYVHDREKKREEENLIKKKALEQAKRKKELEKQEEELEKERQRRRQAEEEELNRMKEEFERQRLADKARREAEYQEQQEANVKKDKSFLKIFKKKKSKQ